MRPVYQSRLIWSASVNGIMDDFLIAGSTSGETDERLLHQVAQIAGYTSTIRALVRNSFRFCNVHGTPIPKSGRRPNHADCKDIKVAPRAGPRTALR